MNRPGKRLRLLFVARRYWPAVGGVESFLRDLARQLAREHKVTVLARRIDDGQTTRLSDSLTGPPPFEPFDDGGVRVVPLDISGTRRAALVPLLAYVVPGFRRYAWGRARIPTAELYARVVAPLIAEHAQAADVIHTWSGDLLGLAGARAARLCGVASVITPFAHPNQYGTGPVDVVAYRATDRIVALLDADAAVYRGLGVPSKQIVVCGVGSDGVPAGHGEEIRRRYRIDGPLVVFLGVRRSYKGFDLLLQAAPHVAQAVAKTTFAFLGPGDPVPDRVGGARIIDAGFVDERERAGWLEAADLLCLPSEAEIFPVSVLEAWSVYTPVVLSDIPSLAELAARSGGGVAVPREARALASTIASLLLDAERLRRLGVAGHAFWVAHHTIDAVAQWYERQYAALADRLAPGVLAA